MKNEFDAWYWTFACPVVAGVCVALVGHDWISNGLMLGIGGAGALGAWRRTRHMAQWAVGGLTAIAGALLTLILEASMNGASADPSLPPVLISFVGGAIVSGVLHHQINRTQSAEGRALLNLVDALPTVDDLRRVEAALARLNAQPTPPSSWNQWWSSRPRRRR